MGKSHALRPLLCWKSLAGWVLRIVMNVIHILGGADCSVADMPQILKKWGGGTMFNQNWEKKEKVWN